MNTAKHFLLAALSLGAVLPMVCMNGCLVSSSSNVTHTGTNVGDSTWAQVVPGKSMSWVAAVLGEPTSKQKLDDGSEIWKWTYTERTDNSGAVFLIFGGSSSHENSHTAFVEFKDGVVTNHWRG